MPRLWGLSVLCVVVIVTAACSGGDSSDETSTTLGAGSTATAPSSTTTLATGQPPGPSGATGATGTTTTTLPAVAPTTRPPPEYSIEARARAPEGDTVVVLVEPGDYDDADLEYVVTDTVDRFAPIGTMHVVDHAAAVSLVLEPTDDLAEEQAAFLAEHYLLRLEDGFRMIFQGPLDDLGEIVLGS